MEFHAMPGHLIRRLHQISTQVFQTRIKGAGLDMTQVQFAAMDALRANPGIDQAGVANLIAYDRATIGGVIDRLEQKGWLRRVVNMRDRRARTLSLTEDGVAAHAAALPLVRDLQAEILAGLDPEETGLLIGLLRKATTADPAAAS